MAMPPVMSGGFGGDLRAVVTPRVSKRGSKIALPIDQVIRELIQVRRRGAVTLSAAPGGGVSTALVFLRERLAKEVEAGRLVVTEQRTGAEDLGALVVSAGGVGSAEVYDVAPWAKDDCVEYLAATHRSACADVLARVEADRSFPFLEGRPQLVARALDAFAANPIARHAIVELGEQLWQMSPPRHRASRILNWGAPRVSAKAVGAWDEPLPAEVERWWRHEPLKRYFAARWIIEVASTSGQQSRLTALMKWNILPEAAFAAKVKPELCQAWDEAIAASPRQEFVAAAASVLLAADPSWRPRSVAVGIDLRGAYLAGAQWGGLDLTGADLAQADLTGADLAGATLDRADLTATVLAGANLRSARARSAQLERATFDQACLASADLTATTMESASLVGADLTAANCAGALLDDANLESAAFDSAVLREAKLGAVKLEGARFTSARLDQAQMSGVDLSAAADWTGASFGKAQLRRCNLEGISLPNANFLGAKLAGSLFTGSHMPGADFTGADLSGAGLADVDWPGAKLGDASLRNATFHMGSSRSGLVGSSIPCEGSRTGFYTDESFEQHYRRPEEIRKANLTSCVLTGALIAHSDFYLVDVRGAIYTPQQEKHLAATGAILHYPYP